LPGCGFGHRVGDVPVPRLSSTGAVTIAADLTSGGAKKKSATAVDAAAATGCGSVCITPRARERPTEQVNAAAQQPATPVIGFLIGTQCDDREIVAVWRGLNDAGYLEGQNVASEYRWADGHYDRLPALASDLVRRQVAVIIAAGASVSPRAAKAATATIPIVFLIGSDPVDIGLVASLSRPGGNVTGVTLIGTELGGKQLGLLREMVPKAAVIALLLNPNSPNAELSG